MFLLDIVLLLVNATIVNGIYSNLAVGKPTRSSSYTGTSGRAVDGDMNTDFFDRSCWQSSGSETDPYWMVDLQANYFLGHVTLTNRGDCCGERLHDLKIEVFAEDPVEFPTTPSTLCAMYEGPMPTGATENISCSCLTYGRYLRIEGQNRQNPDDRLTLCEVETYSQCFSTIFRRIVGTRFVGDVYQTDLTSTVACAKVCAYNGTCVGFNFHHDSLICELRVGDGEALDVPGWSHFVWDSCA
ncbi:fucolectin-like [Haliotis cracherodii]|uniref:fucolectin-like n=1 Tax=Haliotis cracherodii TaxID=6455 RepID=UPI0039ED7CF0